MKWTVHGEDIVYDNEWLRVALVDVEVPGGPRFGHHVVRPPSGAAGAVVFDPDRGVLMLWRHRFIADAWGWEIPAGRLEPGEDPAVAAAREALEETGWQPGPLRLLTTFYPTIGFSSQTFSVYLADGAEHVGDPADPTESERIEWVPLPDLRAAIEAGEIIDGLTLNGLLYAMALGLLPG